MLKYVVIGVAAVAVAFGVGCSNVKNVKKVKNVVVKDVALEDQLSLLEKYQGRHAWTRGTIEDLTERVDQRNEPKKKVIPRDTKVTVVDINFAYRGAVTVDDPKGKRIVTGLECERPLTPEGSRRVSARSSGSMTRRCATSTTYASGERRRRGR